MLKYLLTFFSIKKYFLFFILLKIFVMFLSLSANVLIVRKLTVNDYGIFTIAFMFISLITTFGFSWSSSSIIYFGSREKLKKGNLNQTFWARNVLILISIFITTVSFIIFRNSINTYIGIDVSYLILLWLYISVSEDYFAYYFLAIKKQIIANLLSITSKSIYLILLLIFSFDIKMVIVLNIVSHSSIFFFIFLMDKKDISKIDFNIDWFKKILNFSLWQLFGYSGLYLINFGDTILIKHFMTIEDVGVYNAAYKLFNAIASFSYVISSFFAGNVSQYFENKDNEKIKHFFYHDRIIIVILSAIVHLLFVLLSRPLIILLYGRDYINSIKIFQILMIGSIFMFLSVFYTLYYNTNYKHKIQQSINILRAVLNVLLDIIFIRYFGLVGPAIATVLSIIITFLISAFYCEKKIFI